MKVYLKVYYAFLFITSLIFLNSNCANGDKINGLSKHLVDLYEKDQNVSAKESETLTEEEKPKVLNYIALHYLMGEDGSKQSSITQNPIKFIHTMIGLIYPKLSGIINKNNWEMLTKEELVELIKVNFDLFKGITEAYPNEYKLALKQESNAFNYRVNIIKQLKTYLLESSAEYLSQLFKEDNRKAAQEFVANYYLNNNPLLKQLIDLFIDLKSHQVENTLGLEQILSALNDMRPSQALENMIDKIIDSTMAK